VWAMFRQYTPLMLLIACGLTLSTGIRLVRMSQVRGWLPGATIYQETVTRLGHHERLLSRRLPRHAYWVEYGPGYGNRATLPWKTWKRLEVGSTIEIIQVPGDSDHHIRGDDFASDRSFVLEGFLLTLELVGVVYCARFLWRALKEKAFADPTPSSGGTA